MLKTLRDLAREMHLDRGAANCDRCRPGTDQRVFPRATSASATTQAVAANGSARRNMRARDIVTGGDEGLCAGSAVVSIDSDLATTSGLEAGVAAVDQKRALNVGVAEANMMLIGEAFAALGYNTWVSTFCPFFDWKVLRRIAVGHRSGWKRWMRPTAG